MNSCFCGQYNYLQLDTGSIYDRLAETRTFLKNLELVNEHNGGEHKLFHCSICPQNWQQSKAWIWNNIEYAFKVPKTMPEDWQTEPYLPPDEMTYYNKSLRDFLNRQNLSEQEIKCKTGGCERRALIWSVKCLRHHIEWMQQKGSLLKKPAGKIFFPYSYNEDDFAFYLV